MTTWRLAAAETLLFGDALDVFVPEDGAPSPDGRLVVEALRGIGIVRVVVADLVPPALAVRTATQGVPATSIEVELTLRGRGETRRVCWAVEFLGPNGFERRCVDAYSGAVYQGAIRSDEPAAILLTRSRARGVDLALWARSVIGLPISIEVDIRREPGGRSMWSHVVRGRPEPAAV